MKTYSIRINDSCFDQFIQEHFFDFVIFDRFMTEEQYGWRVEKYSPDSIRILDTVDLHFLRRTRHQALKKGASLQEISDCSYSMDSEDTLRELASIYRSDTTFLLSDFELKLLIEQFQISQQLLFVSRFHYSKIPPAASFEERKDFSIIGNFRHLPNSDGVFWFKKEIWPLIRKRLPDSKVYIYGAYPSKEIMSLTHAKENFHVVGPIDNPHETLGKHRVNLAPLRFGAGIKGKVSDGWIAGTPVITTQIGAEGMSENMIWGGEISNSPTEFAEKAFLIYTDQKRWTAGQQAGFAIIDHLYSSDKNQFALVQKMIQVKTEIKTLRQKNRIGKILNYSLHRSTQYFSKWIEVKNQLQIQTKDQNIKIPFRAHRANLE